MKVGILAFVLFALCCVARAQAQLAAPTTCALTSSNTTCVQKLTGNNFGGAYYSCTAEVGGVWTGQLDFQRVGVVAAAAISGLQPNSALSGAINTTANGVFTSNLLNAPGFQVVVDTPGSFTGTAQVAITCSPATHSI